MVRRQICTGRYWIAVLSFIAWAIWVRAPWRWSYALGVQRLPLYD